MFWIVHLLALTFTSIFTYQSNLVLQSGVDPSLQANVFKSCLKIYYPHPYRSIDCRYQHVINDIIIQAIELFDWEKAFSNLDANKQVSLYNETIMNIFENFDPRETVPLRRKRSFLDDKQIKTIQKENNNFFWGITRRIFCAGLSENLRLTNQATIETSTVVHKKKVMWFTC